MPLIDLQTDLKSLRYGKDRPGGGSSNQPFHKVDYRRKFEQSIDKLAQTGGTDGFIRGGYLVPGRVLADEERLLKYFLTAEGLLFPAQQNLLSTLGVRIYGGYPTSVTVPNIKRLNGGTYTPLSTLAAAAGNPFGAHPNKQGIDFTGQNVEFSLPRYIDLVNGSSVGGFLTLGNPLGIRSIENNRLINLYENKITNLNGFQSTELYKYKGGPQAGKGGKSLDTIISTASFRTQFSGTNAEFIGTSLGFTPLNYTTYSQNQLNRLTYNSSDSYFVVGSGTITTVQDFRKQLINDKNVSNISESPNYKVRNIENRVNLGDPGARGVNRRNYTNGVPQNYRGLDSLNALYLYQSSNVNNTDVRTNDLVKFRIAVIDNDNPNLKTFAHFRAFINSFDDNMSATWDPFKYLGRGEDFYTYKGFSRTNNVSFTLMAQSIQEMSVMYQKLNYIISSLTPDYGQGGYMRGNLVQLTLGGYYYEMPGIIENITVTIPNDATWEIGIPVNEAESTRSAGSATGFTGKNIQELPHRLDVSMTFKPIHNFLPQVVGSSYSKAENPDGINGGGKIKQRFLSLSNANPEAGNNLYSQGVDGVFKVTNTTFQPAGSPNPQPIITLPTRPSILDPLNPAGGVQRASPIQPIR
jgi:hypothetical protein